MSRHAFFSFHYQRDIIRVSQVRNSWVTQDRETAGFWDAVDWESVKRSGDAAIKEWIEKQLNGTSVTVVLIGAETASRPFVIHEIQRSAALGKGIIGVKIHGLKNFDGQMDSPGQSPFEKIYYNRTAGREYLSQIYPVYDYVTDDGYNNMNEWIEKAALAAGK